MGPHQPSAPRGRGRQASQPAWLARTLPLYGNMLSWHDRAAQSFVATPPSVSMHTAYAVVLGPRRLYSHLAPKSRAAWCLGQNRRDPQALYFILRRLG
jgi:hypothetical protein